MYGYDLIVVDEEFRKAGTRLKGFCDSLKIGLEEYRKVLDNMCSSAVKSGKLRDALVLYKEYVDKTRKLLEGLGEKAEKLTGEYISKIEEADDYLYNGKEDSRRDFSKEQYENLQACLFNPICSVTDGFGDWLYGMFYGIVDFLPWDGFGAKNVFDDFNIALLDFNDETKAGLEYMFEKIYKVDMEYGRRDDEIQSFFGPGEMGYISNFLQLAYALEGINNMIAKMLQVIGMEKGTLSSTAVENCLGKEYETLKKELEQTINIGKKPVTKEEIIAFAQKPEASQYFDDFTREYTLFVEDVGAYEIGEMLVFNGFDIAERHIFELGYENYMRKKLLMDAINEIAKHELYEDGEEQEALNQVEEMMGYVEKYGNDWYEEWNSMVDENGHKILDGRTKGARMFRDFLGALGGAEMILKYGDGAIGYIAGLFANYTRGIEIIESLERNYSNNAEMIKSISEIKSLYNKEFKAWFVEAMKGAANVGFEVAIKELSKEGAKTANVLGVINKISTVIDVGGKATGLGDNSVGRLDAMFYARLYETSGIAYNNALEKLRTAKPEDENYDELVSDLNNCFELNKSNMIKMLESMEKASNGEKKSYYRYCTDRAKAMSITSGTPQLLSYDQYVAKYGA